MTPEELAEKYPTEVLEIALEMKKEMEANKNGTKTN